MACNMKELRLAVKELHKCINAKNNEFEVEKWNDDTVLKLLNYLSTLILDPKASKYIGKLFPEILFPLICASIKKQTDFELHHKNCIILSELVEKDINILRYAYQYFSDSNTVPWLQNEKETTPKKAKFVKKTSVSSEEILKCCLKFLKADQIFFKSAWNWSEFLDRFYKEDKCENEYLVKTIIGVLFNLSEVQKRHLMKDCLLDKIQNEFNFETVEKYHFKHNLQKSDLFKNWTINRKLPITCIEGVFLYIYNQTNVNSFKNKELVMVDSVKENLRNVAMGIGSGKPICLSGPVGSGKTSLVEYLATKTGRISNKNYSNNEINENLNADNQKENRKSSKKRKHKNEDSEFKIVEEDNKSGFLRIQLGHETDSKTLLGQYCCTDMPGEFIWQPGVLTQAVINGNWLLLEDLDSATQDVCTVLTNLLENGHLSVPGFRDFIKIKTGFQLFFTIRTQNAGSASTTFFQILEKHLYMVNINPLSRSELSEIISEQFPKLATVAPKIVNVFLGFSSGCHDVVENGDSIKVPRRHAGGRMISTRDLLKLCHRSNPNFSVTSTECAYFVFQNAVDLFCSHLPDGATKTDLVTEIGGKLGIIQSRCEFLAKEYKPSVEISQNVIKCGRGELKRFKGGESKRKSGQQDETSKKQRLDNEVVVINDPIAGKGPSFSFTRLASCLVERVMISVHQNEPVLLVGETGVGKTSSIQYLAHQTGHKLMVVNMNNQSDVADLVGGFKPVDLKFVINPIRIEFDDLFRQTFNSVKNESFLNKILVCYRSANYQVLIKTILTICKNFYEKMNSEKFSQDLIQRWTNLEVKCKKLDIQLNKSINITFSFIPGSLVNCLKNGDWILLDEINLATAETLECLSTILEPEGSIVLLEKGDLTPVSRHPDFRIFACMNPNTDIGKKDLPTGIRNRFTEYFVDELTTEGDLTVLIGDYLSNSGIQKGKVINLVKLYKKLKSMSELELNDGLGNRPVYSLRTLCRALSICSKNYCGSIERNLYESFCLSFLTQVDQKSHEVVLSLIQKSLVQNLKAMISYQIPKPANGDHLNFEGYWIEKGSKEELECKDYILTDSVRMNLKDLARIISIGKLPILLQGPTSAGKTSLIEYIAKRSGNFFLRINNHEHTDLQEYIGTYTTDVHGKLTFKEGVLVQAMRNGYWIILDELNLAPSDILEALNRVLDDNRELFIPETQVTVKAHPNFMLFATQNPPGLYGGRKTLSRAFKNRFIELHFNEIPQNELEIILEKRCQIPQSYALKMVKTMAELQMNRSSATKQTFTLRDLFRWGNRYTFADKNLLAMNTYDWNQHLVDEGYLVLSAKVRNSSEIQKIEDTLFKNFRKSVNLENLFSLNKTTSGVTKELLEALMKESTETEKIVWTMDMRRMAIQAGKAIQFNEPVLLVGPTGCGKTTICQILAKVYETNLRILNCHLHTEAADFLGGLRPYRSDDTKDKTEKKQLFEWTDGPLVYSMTEGSFFLADEISLAEDSVLERLNCILEPERTVLLVEKVENNYTNDDSFIVKGKEGFQFFATMNPGGDFGKKELSPALRNRFTEIWCRPTETFEDLTRIAQNSLKLHLTDSKYHKEISEVVVSSVFYLKSKIDKFNFSVRDVLAWIEYIAINCENSTLNIPQGLLFGMEAIFLDFLEMIPHQMESEIMAVQKDTKQFLVREIVKKLETKITLEDLDNSKGTEVTYKDTDLFGIEPFFMKTYKESEASDFLFAAPTTQRNLFQLLSALTVKKAILLEGPPGVGKTSLVENLAKTLGYSIVRINLCEHTDLADLFGTDLPCDQKDIEDGNMEVGSFMWRDGPLMAALKSKNTWILLDELNLAPQNVLEGLNAILDHRGEVYIPELNKSFRLKEQTKIFASQNPLNQGGGRKGLPQSFLNRFTKVYMKKLRRDDLLYVVRGKYGDYIAKLIELFPEMDNIRHLAERMVQFSDDLDYGIGKFEFGHKGGPFEMNLRDILQWFDFLENSDTGFVYNDNNSTIENYNNFLLVIYEKMRLVYCRKMRSEVDQEYIRRCFKKNFDLDVDKIENIANSVSLYWTNDSVYLNDIKIPREPFEAALNKSSLILSSQLGSLKDLGECILRSKPVILCGGTDSGKTKLIDSICSLFRNEFHVDTIDDSVTGSFQQVDLNRHLEELFKLIETEYNNSIQSALGSNKKPNVSLIKLWENYQNISDTKSTKSSINDEIVIFNKRLNAMESLLKQLFNKPPGLPGHIGVQLATLKSMLKRNSSTLNSGGQFEWVDSKIVKALKQGQFINLEHVNLCSSAVLDRLNSVFEPNGTLLIAEKALTKDDELEVIQRHDNFRAFLTLDPKNGEISRAMRNRCVEIYLERNSFSEEDMKKLVYNLGIEETSLIDTVVNIHKRLSTVSEHSSYSISDLLKLAFLVSENKRLGMDDKEALEKSGIEVYIRSTLTDTLGFGLDYYKEKMLSELTETLKEVDLKEKSLTSFGNLVLKTTSLNEVSKVQLHCEVFKVILSGVEKGCSPEEIKYNLLKIDQKFEEIDSRFLNRDFLNYLLFMAFEMSSYEDIKLRAMYLSQCISKYETTPDNKLLVQFIDMIFLFIEGFLKNSKIDKQLPWNRKIFPRIRDYLTQKSNDLETLKLSLHMANKLVYEYKFLPELKLESKTKSKEMNFLTYSRLVSKKEIVDDLNNELITGIFSILDKCDKYFERNVNSLEEGDFNIVHVACWPYRLLQAAKKKLYKNQKKEVDELNLNSLLLHFQWFRKKFNFRTMRRRAGDSFVLQFESLIDGIRNDIDSQQHPLFSMQKYGSKHLIDFVPFFEESQIEHFKLINGMEEKLAVKAKLIKLTPDELKDRLKLLTNDQVLSIQSVYYQTVNPLKELKDNEGVPQTGEEALCSEISFKELTIKLEDVLNGTSLNPVSEVIPILEYFSAVILSNNLLNTTLWNELNEDFFIGLKFTDLDLLHMIKTVTDSKWRELLAFWESNKCKPIIDILSEPALKKDYRVFASVWRSLLRAQKKYLNNSLITRPNLLNCLCEGEKNTDAGGSRNEFENLSISNYGPLFTFAAMSLLYGGRGGSSGGGGGLKVVGLGQLEERTITLQTAKQLLWNNIDVISPSRNLLLNDFQTSVEAAERCLKEVRFVQNQISKELTTSVASFADFNTHFNKMLTKLEDNLDESRRITGNGEAKKEEEDGVRKRKTNILLALVGAIELNTLCYFPFVDPVEKSKQKMEFVKEDLCNVQRLIYAYRSMGIVTSYELLGHEIRDELESHLRKLKSKESKFTKKVPLRPELSLYQALKKDVFHFLNTCLQPKSLCSLMDAFEQILNEERDRRVETTMEESVRFLSDTCELIKRMELLINNAERFEYHTLKPYQFYYRDFVEPIEYSITCLKYALNGLIQLLIEAKDSMMELNNGYFVSLNDPKFNLMNLVRTMVEFPALNRPVMDELNDSVIFNRMPNGDSSAFKLLKSEIMQLLNQTQIQSQLDDSLFFNLDNILNALNTVWRRQDEQKRKRLAEESSLYVTKVSIDEDEDEESAVQEHFPNYMADDFGDFIHSDLNGNVAAKPVKKATSSSGVDLIADEDHKFICLSFIGIIEEFLGCCYRTPSKRQSKPDFITPFQIKINVFHDILESHKTPFDYHVDDLFYLGSSVLINSVQSSMSSSVLSDNYDFYKDSNVNEVVACTEFLSQLRTRVDVELVNWPDHAVLNDIITIVNRVENLPITSPIVRFNTGFQLLQRKIGEWNSVAHKSNNLLDLEVKCSEFIQRWTKLEMQYWRECLDHCVSKIQSRSYKYFFFFYNLIYEYLNVDQSKSRFNFTDLKSIQTVFESSEELVRDGESRTTEKDVIVLLNQFMESSTYGEFEVRLRLIKSFELYIHGLQTDNGVKKQDLISIFHHIHMYFDQFSQEIQDHIKTVRSPIEKKLKEFVKIESYNKDLSYIGMRNNIVKVQKTIHKFFKEFESHLINKVATNFSNKMSESPNLDISFISDDKGKDLRFDAKVKYYVVDAKLFVSSLSAKDTKNATATTDESWTIFRPKIEKYFAVSRNIVKEIINSCDIPSKIQDMDGLLSEEVEGFTYLRELEVDRSQERAKQKSQAKQILNQKRKALADGFKLLTTIGLNYRAGLLEYQLNSNLTNFKIRPFDIKAMVYEQKYKRTDNNLLYLSERVHSYYAKAIHKMKVLFDVLNRPHSDIGMNMERMKGFAVDLFLITQTQRETLSKLVYSMQSLRTIIRNLSSLSNLKDLDDKNKDVPFASVLMKVDRMKKSSSQLISFFTQFRILIDTIPNELDPKMKAIKTTLLNLSECSNLKQQIQKDITNIISKTSDLQNHLIAIPHNLKLVDPQNVKDLENSYYNIIKQVTYLKDNINNGQQNLLGLQISKLLDEISINQKDDKPNLENQIISNLEFTSNTEKIVHSMLISMQKVFKKYTMEKKGEAEEEMDIGQRFKKGHLKEGVFKELISDIEVLELKKLEENLLNMMSLIETPGNENVSKLTSILPLIDQFGYLVEYYTIQQLGSHKVSLKILSVMLTIFIELGKNGFCVPQDLLGDEDDKQKDDKGDKNGEGFGLEDGTGEKDVSDRIESEDQLEDAKRPEEYNKEKNEDQNNKEEKGIDMSEDFDSNLQDVEKKPEDENESDDDEKEEEEEHDKEMGETEEGAEKLDDQIWGDDENKTDEETDDEKNEEDGKGNSEEQEGHNDLGDKTEGSDEQQKDDGLDAADNQPEDNRKKKEKDIDKMKEPEIDEEQTNPYHNQLEEPEEPEAMDLDNTNLDDEDRKEDQEGENEENPFDIDQMKDNFKDIDEDVEMEENPEEKDDKKENDSSDDEDQDDDQKTEEQSAENPEKEKNADQEKDENGDQDENPNQEKGKEEQNEESEKETELQDKEEEHSNAKDNKSKQENIQSVPEDQQAGTKDQVEAVAAEKDDKNPDPTADQDTGEDKDGVGQAENQESSTGHKGVSEFKNSDSKEEQLEKKEKDSNKKGNTNEDRTLADHDKNENLKTTERINEETNDETPIDDRQADEFEHVKEAKSSDRTTMDNATEEQSRKVEHKEMEIDDDEEENPESNPELMETTDPELENKQETQQLNSEKSEEKSKSRKPVEENQIIQNEEDKSLNSELIDGERVETMDVPRGNDTTSHCQMDLVRDQSTAEESTLELAKIKRKVDQEINQKEFIRPESSDFETWQRISSKMMASARDLCEQLRLILEPTKCTRLRGDYRSGRRINMKKIIPYLASQFRKDKIWLRRTKAAKRDYKITIAIDDSKSMHHNQSKELTLEAISLVAQALQLLESGKLSVVSFGETSKILSGHSEQFDGPKLIKSLNFDQNHSRIAELLNFVRVYGEEDGSSSDSSVFENLLLVLSDGRNIFSEGEQLVRNAIKLAKLRRIFMVYIIIDNPDNKHSILDIKVPQFSADRKQITLQSYLDSFPFPYYVIVRDLGQLPAVLSDAMRQWFELVNSEQQQ